MTRKTKDVKFLFYKIEQVYTTNSKSNSNNSTPYYDIISLLNFIINKEKVNRKCDITTEKNILVR